MQKLFVVFFVMVNLLNCSKNKVIIKEIGVNPDIHFIDVDKAEKVDDMFLSEICSEIKTIILETSDDILLGRVDIVQIYKDLLLILDRSNNVGLYAFNKEGKFIRKYGGRGGGPGEYISISDFTIDKKNEILYVLDSEADLILKYEIETGKYIDKIIIENNIIDISFIQYNNERLYCFGENYIESEIGCMVHEINMSTGKITQCWLDTRIYNKGWSGSIRRAKESFFYARNQEAFKFVHFFMDTIISFEKDQVKPYVVFKDKDWISTNRISRIMEIKNKKEFEGLTRELIDNEISYNISKFVEWNDYFCFRYQKKMFSYFVLHNINTGNTKIAKYILNDLGYNEPNWLVNDFICSDENGVYELIDDFSLERYLEWIKVDGYVKKSLDKYEELRNLPEDTNPVIFYYNFK